MTRAIVTLEEECRGTGATPRPGPVVRAGADRWAPGAAWVGLSLLVAFGLLRHDLWFDELQAWNVARASHGLGDLWGQLRYEGHPVLWYLPLFALTRVTGDPRAMQALQFVVASASFAVILFRAPFAVWLRVTICCSYFLAFEYAVLSRSYGLGVLTLVVALALISGSRQRWGWATVALVALSWTSLLGAVLALVVVWSRAVDGSWPVRSWWPRARGARWSVAAVGTSCALVVLSCIPPADFWSGGPAFRSGPAEISGLPGRLLEVLAAPVRALVPLPRPGGPWNSHVFEATSALGLVLVAVAGVALVVAVSVSLRPFPLAIRTWLAGCVAFAGFFAVVVRPTEQRYVGHLALLLLAAVWFAAASRDAWTERLSVIGKRTLVVVLVLGVLGAAVSFRSVTGPFASNERLADAAQDAGIGDSVVSGADFHGTGVAGYLDRPIWSVAQGEWRRTVRFDEQQGRADRNLTASAVLCDAVSLAVMTGRPVGVIDVQGFDRGERITRIGSVELWRVEPDDAPPEGCVSRVTRNEG